MKIPDRWTIYWRFREWGAGGLLERILPGIAAGEERVQLFHEGCGIQLGELAAKDQNRS